MPATTRRTWPHGDVARMARTVAPGEPIADTLAGLDGVETLYVCGPMVDAAPSTVRAWAAGDGGQFVPDRRGHWYGSQRGAWALRWQRPDGGTLHVVPAWDSGPDAAQWGATVRATERALGEQWGQPIRVARTAAVTGRDLLWRTVPVGQQWPTMPPDLIEWTRAHGRQGRRQWWRRDGSGSPVVTATTIDARLAYLTLAHHLPDPDTAREVDTLDRGRDGWQWRDGLYRFSATVPDGWDRVGMLGGQVVGHIASTCGDCGLDGSLSGACWADQPGATVAGWAHTAEIAGALDAGWQVSIGAGVEWSEGRHTDRWRRQLLAAHETLASGDTVDRGAARMVRAVALAGLGSLHGQEVETMGTADTLAGVPDDADVAIAAGGIEWTQRAGASVADRPAHPEWTTAVWARCRALVTSTAVAVPRKAVATIAQDSVTVVGVPPAPPRRWGAAWHRRVAPALWQPGERLQPLATDDGARARRLHAVTT